MIAVPDWVAALDVSRETFEDLQRFHELVLKWNPKINLVSKGDLSDLWDRHIWDSAQLFEHAPSDGLWADFGSGGGFPAIICAILAKEKAPKLKFACVESDKRKSEFLRTAVRSLGLNASIYPVRVEHQEYLGANLISARALASVKDLLPLVDQHLATNGRALLLKGASWEKEVEEARLMWNFVHTCHKSKTNLNAAVLEIKELKRV